MPTFEGLTFLSTLWRVSLGTRREFLSWIVCYNDRIHLGQVESGEGCVPTEMSLEFPFLSFWVRGPEGPVRRNK